MKENLWNALVHPDRLEKLHIPDSVADANLKAWRYRRRTYTLVEIYTEKQMLLMQMAERKGLYLP